MLLWVYLIFWAFKNIVHILTLLSKDFLNTFPQTAKNRFWINGNGIGEVLIELKTNKHSTIGHLRPATSLQVRPHELSIFNLKSPKILTYALGNMFTWKSKRGDPQFHLQMMPGGTTKTYISKIAGAPIVLSKWCPLRTISNWQLTQRTCP